MMSENKGTPLPKPGSALATEQFYIVAYDIADEDRLRKMARLCEAYGTRVQRSVFECLLTPAQLAQLQSKAAQIVHLGQDKVRYYPLCPRDTPDIRYLGKAPASIFPQYHVA